MASQPVALDPTEPASEYAFEIPASQRPHNRFLKRKLVTLEEEAPSKPFPTMQFAPAINRLAYKLKPESIKTLKQMMAEENNAWIVQIICVNGAAGLLMSFDDYRHLTQFYEWTAKNIYLRQLAVTASLVCGENAIGSKAYQQAEQLLKELVAERNPAEGAHELFELEYGIENNMTVWAKQPLRFYDSLKKGIFCNHCLLAHTSVVPDDGF